jgi:hypothetical protein
MFLDPNTEGMGGVKSAYDIRHICAKAGLEPVKIEPKAIPTIILYLDEVKADRTSPGVIPFGLDYTCDKVPGDGKCKRIFNSFNSERSENISPELLSRLDLINPLNADYAIAG